MTFSLNRDRRVADSVVRVGRKQIRLAIQEIESPSMDRHEAVHEVRKRCKRLRALLRLVQPALGGTYRRENARLRDAAKSLSYLRDSQTLVECLDRLAAGADGELDPTLVSRLRARLVERRDRVAGDRARLEECLQALLATLRHADDRLPKWTFSEVGFPAVAGGLRKTYKRGRKAMWTAYSTASTEQFHEWRKYARYHAHHLRLLRPLWKPVLSVQQSQAEQLAELLGNDHDLDILRRALLDDPAAFGDEHTLAPLLDLIDRHHQKLRQQARALGGRVFAEHPDALVARFGTYWQVWSQARAPKPRARPPRAARAAAAHRPAQLHGVG